jgi:hypothetical protein
MTKPDKKQIKWKAARSGEVLFSCQARMVEKKQPYFEFNECIYAILIDGSLAETEFERSDYKRKEYDPAIRKEKL